MKNIITLLLIVFTFAGCSNDGDDKTQNPVVGNWKLIKTRNIIQGNNNPIVFTDYSSQNKIYKFDTKSNLTITTGSNVEQYKYEYKIDYLTGDATSGGTKSPVVIIEGVKYGYLFLDGQMILEQSYVDGEDLYLVKQ